MDDFFVYKLKLLNGNKMVKYCYLIKYIIGI